MSFLNEDEEASLRIRRMILHVVGGNEEFARQAEQQEIEQEEFFLQRIRNADVDGVHSFDDDSPTKGHLERVARQPDQFEACSQELSKAFARAHVGGSAAGAFFVFELSVSDTDVLIYRPYLLLAEHALAALVSNVHLAQAVSIDHRVWALWLKGNQTIVWWADKETQPFIIAVGLYGMEMAHKGTAWMATKCLNFLLGLALADKISAVDLFAEAGLIHSGAEPSTPGGMT